MKLSEPWSEHMLFHKRIFLLMRHYFFFACVLGFLNFRFLSILKHYLLKYLTTSYRHKNIQELIKINFKEEFFNISFQYRGAFLVSGRNEGINYFSFLHTECLRVINKTSRFRLDLYIQIRSG